MKYVVVIIDISGEPYVRGPFDTMEDAAAYIAKINPQAFVRYGHVFWLNQKRVNNRDAILHNYLSL